MPEESYRELIEEGIKFAVTGGSGLIANLLLLTLLVEGGDVPEAYAAIVSTTVVLLGGFLLTDRWVFGDVGRDSTAASQRGVGYFAVMLSGKLVNYGLYLAFISIGVQYRIAWVIGSVLVFVLTFSANRLLWYDKF